MSKRTCSIDGCESPVLARGWCGKHYKRWQAHGDPTYTIPVKPRGTCSVDGCDRSHYGRDLCRLHWKRMKTFGSTEDPRQTIEERFWSKVDKSGECWEWTGALRPNGYGVININGKTTRAHRYTYEKAYGSIPAGDVDHECRNRKCVRPSHLRPATRKENSEHLGIVRANNQSGYRGVYFGEGRWRAQITHNGVTTYLGGFDTAEEAGEAARKARLDLFTHNDLDRIA